MIRSSHQYGYTLLEVVVALSILALSLAALAESYSLSLRRSQRADNLGRAALLAASVRDRLGADIALDGTSQSGQSGDCSWSVADSRVPRPATEAADYPQGYQAHISAHCGEGAASREAALDLFALAGERS